MSKRTPTFKRPDGSFDKTAYNKWYYENHKNLYKSSRFRGDGTGPSPVGGMSEHQTAAEKAYSKKYYDSQNAKNVWTISPKKTNKTTGWTDTGKYIDNNIDAVRWEQDVNHKHKMRLAKEAGASSTDINKMNRQYDRAQSYADNERAKLIKQYDDIAKTYTTANDIKLAKVKIKKEIRSIVRNYLDNYNDGMDTIVSQARKAAPWFKEAQRVVTRMIIGFAGRRMGLSGALRGALKTAPDIVSRYSK